MKSNLSNRLFTTFAPALALGLTLAVAVAQQPAGGQTGPSVDGVKSAAPEAAPGARLPGPIVPEANPNQVNPSTTPDVGFPSPARPSNGGLPRRTAFFRPAGAQETEFGSQIDGLVQQLGAAASDIQREDLKAKLGDLVAKQFDARQARHKQEIEALEAQVEKLRGLVERRRENRAEIVSRRVEQFVRESQGLGF
jgi:hypothetical protein